MSITINPNDFKVHASGAYDICAGKVGLTDDQLARKEELTLRESGHGKPLTEKMVKELAELKFKHENPELPAGAKTVCRTWLMQQLYGRKKSFTSKYTTKGNLVEAASFQLIAQHYNIDVPEKNDEYFENDFIIGTPDIVEPFGIDAKNPWDCFTFPLFEDTLDKQYFYQGQPYMALTGTTEWRFAYVLSNMPDQMVMAEARKWCYNEGVELTPQIFEEFKERLTYDDVPTQLRVKSYLIERDEVVIGDIYIRVGMCRKYISGLIDKLKLGGISL